MGLRGDAGETGIGAGILDKTTFIRLEIIQNGLHARYVTGSAERKKQKKVALPEPEEEKRRPVAHSGARTLDPRPNFCSSSPFISHDADSCPSRGGVAGRCC